MSKDLWIVFGALILALTCAPVSAQDTLVLSDLKCNYLSTPLGLDDAKPRFSWTITSQAAASNTNYNNNEDVVHTSGPRGVTQDAYRVLVGTNGVADGSAWDSGWVNGSSLHAQYNGTVLPSRTVITWIVQSRLTHLGPKRMPTATQRSSQHQTNVLATSAPQQFLTGMLDRDQWTGKFIGAPSTNTIDDDEPPSPWFRKTFAISSQESNDMNHDFFLFVASIGFHEAYINGQPVAPNTALMPSISYLPKRALYRVYNVTHLLVPGQNNSLGLWISSGWAEYPTLDHNFKKAPIVLAELHSVDQGSKDNLSITKISTPLIVTDSSWRCHPSNTSHTGGRWGSGGFGGDAIDARSNVPGWELPEFDDHLWPNATLFDLPDSIELSADVMEPTVRHSLVNAKTVTHNATDGSYLVEMDEVFSGWFEMANLQGGEGETVVFQVSTTAGRALEFHMQDSFTFGKGADVEKQTFRMRFAYHEIQFITITGLHSPPALQDVTGVRLFSNFTRTGSFNCSSSLLTKIYTTTINNYQGLTVGGETVDCPHRERRGYGGDGHASYEFALANYGVGAYFTKWARDFADVQQPNGWVPHTAPTFSGGGGPAWSGFVVTLPWQMYQANGDISLLTSMYPTMKSLLGFYHNHTSSSDGLLHPWTATMWDFLGDWLTPHGSESVPTSKENILFNNCYLHYIMTLTSKVATLLGDHNAATNYSTQAAALAANINRAFFNTTTTSYIDQLQTHLSMPLATGVVQEGEQEKVLGTLANTILVANNSHVDTGLTGTYFMTKLLTEVGRNDLVFAYANQTTYPGYGYFLEQGFTTWPEIWNIPYGVSKMHGCYNGIGLWFQGGVAGILIKHANEVPVQIRAGIDAGDVNWASGSRETIEGVVQSSWSRPISGPFRHSISIPMSTKATVLIPAKSADQVTESGSPLGTDPSIKFLKMITVNGQSYAEILVLSGVFHFESSFDN